MRVNGSCKIKEPYPDFSQLNSLWYEEGLGLLWFAMNNPKFSVRYGYGAINLLHVRMRKYRTEGFLYGFLGSLVFLIGVYGAISTRQMGLLSLSAFGLILISFSKVMHNMRKEENRSISDPDSNPGRIQAFKAAFDWGKRLGYIIEESGMWKLNEDALKEARGKKIIHMRLKRASRLQGLPQGKDNGLDRLMSLL